MGKRRAVALRGSAAAPFAVLTLVALMLAGCSSRGSGLPDPDRAPRYFDSACTYEFDRRFVFDYVGPMQVLDDAGEQYGAVVEEYACDLFSEDGVHVALVLVPSLGDRDVVSYGVDLVRAWGLGDAKREDGVLLLWAADGGAGQSVVRVEVGYGLEAVLSAPVVADVVAGMQERKQEAFDLGRPQDEATAYGLAWGAIELALITQERHEGAATTQASAARSSGFEVEWWTYALLGVVVIAVFVPRRSRHLAFSILALLLARGGGRRRGGGGFGGGKSGGGGWNGRM